MLRVETMEWVVGNVHPGHNTMVTVFDPWIMIRGSTRMGCITYGSIGHFAPFREHRVDLLSKLDQCPRYAPIRHIRSSLVYRLYISRCCCDPRYNFTFSRTKLDN